ncbi:MAG: hypothetical protein H6Q75_1757 [Firmicutes bacterium]|nr:hypothetical protein [Bacillota bacterium]
MAINLNTAVVESREQRLGTIIAWDGAVRGTKTLRTFRSFYARVCLQ